MTMLVQCPRSLGLNSGVLQEPLRQTFGLRGQTDPLKVVEQNAFVFFLLLLQDPDLLLELVDGFPGFLLNATCKTGDKCEPWSLFHSLERLMSGKTAGKRSLPMTVRCQTSYASKIR